MGQTKSDRNKRQITLTAITKKTSLYKRAFAIRTILTFSCTDFLNPI